MACPASGNAATPWNASSLGEGGAGVEVKVERGKGGGERGGAGARAASAACSRSCSGCWTQEATGIRSLGQG